VTSGVRRSLFLCNTSGLFDLDLQAELEFYREMKVCPDVKRLTMYGNNIGLSPEKSLNFMVDVLASFRPFCFSSVVAIH